MLVTFRMLKELFKTHAIKRSIRVKLRSTRLGLLVRFGSLEVRRLCQICLDDYNGRYVVLLHIKYREQIVY